MSVRIASKLQNIETHVIASHISQYVVNKIYRKIVAYEYLFDYKNDSTYVLPKDIRIEVSISDYNDASDKNIRVPLPSHDKDRYIMFEKYYDEASKIINSELSKEGITCDVSKKRIGDTECINRLEITIHKDAFNRS
jgi:hypothetical protein